MVKFMFLGLCFELCECVAKVVESSGVCSDPLAVDVVVGHSFTRVDAVHDGDVRSQFDLALGTFDDPLTLLFEFLSDVGPANRLSIRLRGPVC